MIRSSVPWGVVVVQFGRADIRIGSWIVPSCFAVADQNKKSTPESRAKESKEVSEYIRKKQSQQKTKRRTEDVNRAAFKVMRESTES